MEQKTHNFQSLISIEIEPIELVDIKKELLYWLTPHSCSGPTMAISYQKGQKSNSCSIQKARCSEGLVLETRACLNLKKLVAVPASAPAETGKRNSPERAKAREIKRQNSPS